MDAAPRQKQTMAQIYRDKFELFADDAAFLWLLRSIAVNQSNYTQSDLTELEARVDAHIDGLMSAPEESWELCANALQIGQSGEVFAAAALAFRSLDANKIQQAVLAGLQNDNAFKGLVSAMGWLPGKIIHSWIKKFLTSKDMDHKYLAVAACSVRREDPKDYLTTIFQREDCIAHEKLYARSLRLVGELKRFDLLPAVRIATRSENKNIIFWSNWAALLLGDKSVLPVLQEFVLKNNIYQTRAIDICFRALPIDTARDWISSLAKDPEQIRLVIKATAILGDPHAINWLISQMRIPALTRLAGEAFTTITGIDLQENKLSLEALPNLDDQLPNDDVTDSNVNMNEDERLPFPDVNKVAAIWQRYQQRFTPAQRYFMGKNISAEHVQNIFQIGYQRQRQSAALELALINPKKFMPNYAAKGVGE